MRLHKTFLFAPTLAAAFSAFADAPDITTKHIDHLKPIPKVQFLSENFSCLFHKDLKVGEYSISSAQHPCLTEGISYSYNKEEKYLNTFILQIVSGTHVLALVGSSENSTLKLETQNHYPVHNFSFDLVTFDGIASQWTIQFYDAEGKLAGSTAVTGSGHESTNIAYSSASHPIAVVSITPNILTSSFGVTNVQWPPPRVTVPEQN